MTIFARVVLTALLLTAGSGFAALAGEADIKADGSLTWKAGVDGVEIEWNRDGSVKRIYSRYSTPVEFADRKGIATAQIIAEEKAKAGIVRFMQQSVASTRVVAEVQADVSKATQLRGTGSAAKVGKIDERTSIQSLTEVTASFAAGTLRGVIVLEKGFNEKSDEAWIVVGISEKTIGAAQDIREMTSSPRQSGEIRDSTAQPSEIRRSNQKDW